jgi:chromosome partitioning related protein ParA
VPHAKAYKEAATLRMPVHRHERRREGVMPSANSVMHQLAWELVPSLLGVLADERRVEESSS